MYNRTIRYLRRRKSIRDSKGSIGSLREFVYLDDVSVYSILAYLKGGIATEFTESQTASLNSTEGSTSSIGLGGIKLGVDTKKQTGHVQNSQILRKAIIQTSFKELYDITSPSLALKSPETSDIPKVNDLDELRSEFDSLLKDRWILDTSVFQRGDLLEVEVELEAEPVFRMASIISAFCELMEDNQLFLESTIVNQISQMRSIAQVLESLLDGLVPIRGRLVEYKLAKIDGRDVLIHRRFLNHMPTDIFANTHSVFVVGVVPRDLFWKDIRRVLFSKAQYTFYCRLAAVGLKEKWHPVKVSNVLAGIIPQFDDLIRDFSVQAEQAMAKAADASPEPVGLNRHEGVDLIRAYVMELLDHHNGTLSFDEIDDFIQSLVLEENWTSTVDRRRPVFSEVTKRVDETLGLNTPSEVACELRQTVQREADFLRMGTANSDRNDTEAKKDPLGNDRFLDAEIIGIYW